MVGYLVIDIDIENDTFEFYILTLETYIKFLKKPIDYKKRDYLIYGCGRGDDSLKAVGYDELFKIINSKNIEIKDVYRLY